MKKGANSAPISAKLSSDGAENKAVSLTVGLRRPSTIFMSHYTEDDASFCSDSDTPGKNGSGWMKHGNLPLIARLRTGLNKTAGS